MAGDDPIDARCLRCLGEGVGVTHRAPAVVHVHDRRVLAWKRVAGVHHARGAEHDPRVAAGVGRTVKVQVHLLGAAAERQAIRERPLRQSLAAVVLERRGAVHLQAVHGMEILHQLLRVLAGDDLDRRWKLGVAVHMIEVCVRIDDRRDRLVGERLQLLDHRLPPAADLRVDEQHTLRGDERRGVAATAAEHVEVVGQFLHLQRVDGGRTAKRPATAAAGRLLRRSDGH